MSQTIKRILVTGAGGQLGCEFRALSAQYDQWELVFADHQSLDITDADSIRKMFDSTHPDVVINCAAYTNVEQAETEIEKAFQINSEGVKNLAGICREKNTLLIHFSTDYVFDGTKNSPYTELDATNPINVYGKSKLEGEQQITALHPKHYIVRISWLYGTFGKNFFKTMLRLADEQQPIKIVDDQFASPTYSTLLAQDILNLLSDISNHKHVPPYGLYHYTNGGISNWFEFASCILQHRGIQPEPVSAAAFPTKAKRPMYSKLCTDHWEKNTGIAITPWKEALQQCITKYQHSQS